MINASQAEKNRAAAANKYKKTDKNEIPTLGNTLAPWLTVYGKLLPGVNRSL